MIQDIAPKKFHNEYHPEIRPEAGDPVLHFRGRDILVSTKEEGDPWPVYAMLRPEVQVVYAFSIDSFRYFYPDVTGAYSWWSYIGGARARNAGWRIDYFIVSEKLRDRMVDAKIHADLMGSDHCPVELDIRASETDNTL